MACRTNKDAHGLLISTEQFNEFLARHAAQTSLVAEPNDVMKDSYLILDERMRFLNCQNGSKVPSQSILEVPVQMALSQSGFDGNRFVQRQGIYDWVKSVTAAQQPSCATGTIGDIEDLATWSRSGSYGVQVSFHNLSEIVTINFRNRASINSFSVH